MKDQCEDGKQYRTGSSVILVTILAGTVLLLAAINEISGVTLGLFGAIMLIVGCALGLWDLISCQMADAAEHPRAHCVHKE